MSEVRKADSLQIFALALANAIKGFFEKRGGKVNLTREPQVERKKIVAFNNQARLFDIEKFDTPTFISTINYYASPEDMKKNKAAGFLVIYLEQEYIPDLLKALNYPEIEWDDTEGLKDANGALCNVIAGQFKTEISNLTHIELEMSHFSYYQNNAVEGVDFSRDQADKYEISFEIGGRKRLIVEMSMARLPLRY